MTLEDLLDPCGRLIAAGIWLTIFLGAVALTVLFFPLLLIDYAWRRVVRCRR